LTGCDGTGAADRIALRFKCRQFAFDTFKQGQIDRINDHKRSGHAVHVVKVGQ
jgi:hypothetical protein